MSKGVDVFAPAFDRSAIPLCVRLNPACNPSLRDLEKGDDRTSFHIDLSTLYRQPPSPFASTARRARP